MQRLWYWKLSRLHGSYMTSFTARRLAAQCIAMATVRCGKSIRAIVFETKAGIRKSSTYSTLIISIISPTLLLQTSWWSVLYAGETHSLKFGTSQVAFVVSLPAQNLLVCPKKKNVKQNKSEKIMGSVFGHFLILQNGSDSTTLERFQTLGQPKTSRKRSIHRRINVVH